MVVRDVGQGVYREVSTSKTKNGATYGKSEAAGNGYWHTLVLSRARPKDVASPALLIPRSFIFRDPRSYFFPFVLNITPRWPDTPYRRPEISASS